jgi:hypothetical protein
MNSVARRLRSAGVAWICRRPRKLSAFGQEQHSLPQTFRKASEFLSRGEGVSSSLIDHLGDEFARPSPNCMEPSLTSSCACSPRSVLLKLQYNAQKSMSKLDPRISNIHMITCVFQNDCTGVAAGRLQCRIAFQS